MLLFHPDIFSRADCLGRGGAVRQNIRQCGSCLSGLVGGGCACPAALLARLSIWPRAIRAAEANRTVFRFLAESQTRETASAAEKQVAALDTRAVKEEVNRAELVKDWRATADGSGFDQAARLALVALAEKLAAQADHAPLLTAQGQIAAHQAVAFAAEKLGERQSVFSAADFEKEAGRFGLGKVTQGQISTAIDRAAKDGALAPRTFIDKRGAEFGGFTTASNINNEQRLLRAEANGRGKVAAILNPVEAAKAIARAALKSEHSWTADRRQAAKSLLTSQNRVTAMQGYAGTAKTTTVLATAAREAASHGYKVTALAPTASAARTLGEALGTRSETVAKHLMQQAATGGRGVWIVDEASMLSARDTATLLEAADKANARVILVGDVKQLGSVGAGAAFAQLQDAGTARLRHAAARVPVLAALRCWSAYRLCFLLGREHQGLCPLVPETGNRHPRVAGCARWPAPRHRFRFSLPLPSSPEGRPHVACRMRLCRKGVWIMDDVLLQYRACGAETREDYLREVANENGLRFECVKQLAEHLDEREDFGLLRHICEERAGGLQ